MVTPWTERDLVTSETLSEVVYNNIPLTEVIFYDIPPLTKYQMRNNTYEWFPETLL